MGLLGRVLGRDLGSKIKNMSRSLNDFADEKLARDYDQALAVGENRAAKRELLRYEPDYEYANYASKTRVSPTVTDREAGSVKPGMNPYWREKSWAHHTHPVRSDLPEPLSTDDLRWVMNNGSVRGIFAHESPQANVAQAGGSYAERGHRAAKGAKAMQAAWVDNDKISSVGQQLFGSEAYAHELMIPLGQAAKRHGLLKRYGYRPTTEAQAEMIEARRTDMKAMEDAMYRAMWGPIYGLPYPLSAGRIAAAGGVGYGAYEALR